MCKWFTPIMVKAGRDVNAFLFYQYQVELRLRAIRFAIGVVIAILYTFGPYSDFFVEASAIFSKPDWVIPSLGMLFPVLRWMTVAFSLLFCVGACQRIAAIALTVTFGVTNLFVSQFAPHPWSANSHLNLFVFLFCFRGSHPIHEDVSKTAPNDVYGSFIIAFMQCYIALFYFQSGFAKVYHVGFEWFLSGQTVLVSAHKFGTTFGRYLTKYPELFAIGAVATGIIEFTIPVLLFVPRYRLYTAVLAFGLHLGIYLVLGIPFWHLWALFPFIYTKSVPVWFDNLRNRVALVIDRLWASQTR